MHAQSAEMAQLQQAVKDSEAAVRKLEISSATANAELVVQIHQAATVTATGELANDLTTRL